MALTLIDDARKSGARLAPACEILEIDERTYRCWKHHDYDRRIDRKNPAIVLQRRLSDMEKQSILNLCHQPRFASLPPSQIVPQLADEGLYIVTV